MLYDRIFEPSEATLAAPLRTRKAYRYRVCAHGDLFHESVPDEWIDQVFRVMSWAKNHTFQVLTKRPERAAAYLSRFQPVIHRTSRVLTTGHRFDRVEAAGPPEPDHVTRDGAQVESRNGPLFYPERWPLPNVWIGTSVEDQATANQRIPHLLATPAAVRFVSAEPLLGPVNLLVTTQEGHDISALRGIGCDPTDPDGPDEYYRTGKLDWLIVGGESGRTARPMHPDWARALRDQCQAADVPFFFKQWGEWGPDELPSELQESEEIAGRWNGTSHRIGKARAGRLLDGQEWNEMPGGRDA